MTKLRRTWQVVRTLGPFVLAFLRDRRRWVFFGPGRSVSAEQHAHRARRLVDAVASLGPTFIKLGQVFSSRADVLPEPYLTEVGRLQDAAPAVPYAAIEAVLVRELGRPVAEVFEALDPVPIASASLGQVHRARVAGEEVAVKVLRPGVEELVELDLDVSFRILFYLNVLFPNHHIRAVTAAFREFETRVREETDLRVEAEHTEHFRRLFAEDRRVRAPRVVPELTRQRVLVTEFVHGAKVNQLHDAFATGRLRFDALMDTLVEVYLRMMMVDGFLHADPHPGNLLVEEDGTIVFLDFGMVLRVQRATRDRILKVAWAAAREDLDAIISGMYELGMIDPEISRYEIREAAAQILSIAERARQLSPRQIQEMVQALLDTFYTWPLILPEELVYFFRAAALLEGIGVRYDPMYNGLEAVKPVARRLGAQFFTGGARTPGETARGVLGQMEHAVRALYDLVGRAEREELRLRAHPRDVMQRERLLGLLVRRILLGLFASVMALVSTIYFAATRSWSVLLLGNAVALLLFFLILLIPTHLLESPRRRAREVRRGGSGSPSRRGR